MIGGSVGQSQEAAKAKAAAKKAAAANTQYYQDLTENQMKLSLVTSQTQNLVDAINATSEPGPVYTLPMPSRLTRLLELTWRLMIC